MNIFDAYDERSTRDKIVRLFFMFLFFSIIGWIYEMALFFVYGVPEQLYNRGFLLGPYLPIYGFGMLLLIALVYPIKERAWSLGEKILGFLLSFTLIVLITTSLELITSYVLDFLHMEQLWDYSTFSYNFQGRISLNHSLRFGVGGVLFLYIFVPFFDRILTKISERTKEILAIIISVIIFIDLVYTVFIK